MQSTNLDSSRRPDGKLKKGAKINPTGKGGFKERPEDRSDGRWRKEDSISYQYNKLMRLPANELRAFEPETVAQMIAYMRVKTAITTEGLSDTREITDRTEGKAAQSIDLTSNGETLKTALVEFIGSDAGQSKDTNTS